VIIAEYIRDGWLKQENWNVPACKAKEQARRLLGAREVEYILLVDTKTNQKIMYIQRSRR
jgi:hypothetical protein